MPHLLQPLLLVRLSRTKQRDIMKLKFFPFLVGISAIALTTIPMIAKAESDKSQFLPVLQELISKLNLSETQKTQLEQLRLQTRSQIENLLTPEQKTAFIQALANEQSLMQAFAVLNVSPEQRSQIRNVFESQRQSFRNILTEEQRQKLRQEIISKRATFNLSKSRQNLPKLD
jgi:periplasmic protein CpxP/Spy